MQVVERQRFNPTDVTVSAQIERIKAADPQALIAWSTGAPIATVFKAVLEAGLNVPVGTTNGNQTYAQMTQYRGFLPKDLYIPTSVFLPHEGIFQLDPRSRRATKEVLRGICCGECEARHHGSPRLGPRRHCGRGAAKGGTQSDSGPAQGIRRRPNEFSRHQWHL